MSLNKRVTANFADLTSDTKRLINIKHAHQKSLEILKNEICAKRQSLAKNLKIRKKSAFQLGYAQGMKKAAETTSELISRAEEHYDKSLLQMNTDCLNLAVGIAREILQAEITVNTESLAKRIQASINKLVNVDNLQVTAHQDHYKELIQIFSNFPKQVQIKSDDNIEPGNAVIETEVGQINLNWKTQLEVMRQLLLVKMQNQIQIQTEGH